MFDVWLLFEGILNQFSCIIRCKLIVRSLSERQQQKPSGAEP